MAEPSKQIIIWSTNMNKIEYLESQRGKTYSEIVEKQPLETVQGSLLKTHYQELKTILGAGGLRLHLNTFVADTPEKLFALTAVNETFTEQYMADSDFKVNFNVPAVLNTFDTVIALGVIPSEIGQQLKDLAKYKRPVYSITREDCANYFNPGWNEIEETSGQTFQLQLNTRPQEMTLIVVQMKDLGGEWEHATALHGIQSLKPYSTTLPYYGVPRKLRWRCEYLLDATVTVV
jgi:hypothetical protein